MSAGKILATVVAIVALAVPTVAQGATIRVTSAKQTYLSNYEWTAGSARAYLDDAGAANVLPANTALGQIVAAAAFTSTPLTISQYAGLGPYVATIGTQKVGAKGAWDIYVNGKTPSVGAGALILKKQDHVIWFLDDDYEKKGPIILDAQVTVRANGDVAVVVRQADGTGLSPAKGAAVLVDGAKVGVTDAKGRFTYTPPTDPATMGPADWDQLIVRKAGAIQSQTVVESPIT